MPQTQTQQGSEYVQRSFIGGMNLLLEDTHLESNQYPIGFNLRNRLDRLDLIPSSILDDAAPIGLIQEHLTFGKYQILFVSGLAYYKYYLSAFWTQIIGFNMSVDAPRFWTCAVPVAQTNYIRIATQSNSNPNVFDSNLPVSANNVAGASQGNLPGLVVQDNISQPRFIFLNASNIPTCRTIQKYPDWHITFTDANNTTVVNGQDKREYVPIGNCMAWVDGVLFVVSQDFNSIYRSVSGRPLDFVVAVSNTLVTAAPFKMYGAGDATTTSYSVGVGGISCIRALSDDSLFVAASNACFSVKKNLSNNAPKLFGEYTFIRQFLFNANCLSDRAIFDTLGDTRFIDLVGVRSFNAIKQTENEGRNVPFTASIRGAFGSEFNPLIQDPRFAATILFNDYELYGVNTVFGPAIIVYDTINNCWSSFDIAQTGGKRVKIFSKIELDIQVVFAVTEDNKLYKLYSNLDSNDTGAVRHVGVCASFVYAGEEVKTPNPSMEIKLTEVRVIVDRMTKDCDLSYTPYINNRMSKIGKTSKSLKYKTPLYPTTGMFQGVSSIDTQLQNCLFSFPNAEQGWKEFGIIEWTEGSITQLGLKLNDITPMNPLRSQS